MSASAPVLSFSRAGSVELGAAAISWSKHLNLVDHRKVRHGQTSLLLRTADTDNHLERN